MGTTEPLSRFERTHAPCGRAGAILSDRRHLFAAIDRGTDQFGSARGDSLRDWRHALCVPIWSSADQPDGRRGESGWQSERSEEHTSELQSLMRISYAVFCLKKNTRHT